MKKKHKALNKLLLDTSVQIERIKFPELDIELDKLAASNDIYSLNYCLYEYKTGFIKSLIDYYVLVKLYNDPAKANMKWSDKYSRDLKYFAILQGVLQRLNNSFTSMDVETYLRQLEVSILYISETFKMKLKDIVGSFPKNEIVRFSIFSAEDYNEFIKLVNDAKIIPMIDFWKSHRSELEAIVASIDLQKYYTKLHVKLNKILIDISMSDKHRINHGIGDAVIAVDLPSLWTIGTLDGSFDYLCPPLHKQVLKFSKSP